MKQDEIVQIRKMLALLWKFPMLIWYWPTNQCHHQKKQSHVFFFPKVHEDSRILPPGCNRESEPVFREEDRKTVRKGGFFVAFSRDWFGFALKNRKGRYYGGEKNCS